jgi:hypothetical protein
MSSRTKTDLLQESVHTSDDVDIGDIEATNKNTIVVKRGIIHVHYYYIPIEVVEGWDEQVVWLTITEKEVKEKYERDNEPDTANYYTKNQGYDDFDSEKIPFVASIPKKGRK